MCPNQSSTLDFDLLRQERERAIVQCSYIILLLLSLYLQPYRAGFIWVLTECEDNKYLSVHNILFNHLDRPIVSCNCYFNGVNYYSGFKMNKCLRYVHVNACRHCWHNKWTIIQEMHVSSIKNQNYTMNINENNSPWFLTISNYFLEF